LSNKGDDEAHRWAETIFDGVKMRVDGGASPISPPTSTESAKPGIVQSPWSPPREASESGAAQTSSAPDREGESKALGFDGTRAGINGY